MILLPYLHHRPRIEVGLEAHPSAAVIGCAEIASGCTLGELAVLRADGEGVRTGSDCWFGEASSVHIADRIFPAHIGSHVTVGRYALVHACTVGDDCVIGEHAVVMDGSVVGAGAVIAAESVVSPGKKVEGGWLHAGAPARPVERVTPELRERLHAAIRGDRGVAVPHVLAAARAPRLRHVPGSGAGGAFGPGVYVAPSATLAGRVVLHPCSSLWFGVEVDAGDAVVEIGAETNVQDNSRLYGGGAGEDIRIGPRVLIGHNVRIFPCTIEEGAIIGMGSIIAPGTVVRKGACVAAGAMTEAGTEVEAGQIWAGRPARRARPLSERNRFEFSRAIDIYVEYAANYIASAAPAATARPTSA